MLFMLIRIYYSPILLFVKLAIDYVLFVTEQTSEFLICDVNAQNCQIVVIFVFAFIT